MSELKPCPFCGGEVEIIATGLYHWKYAIRHKSKTECILDANAFALPYEKDDATRMWNTRVERKDEPQADVSDIYVGKNLRRRKGASDDQFYNRNCMFTHRSDSYIRDVKGADDEN